MLVDDKKALQEDAEIKKLEADLEQVKIAATSKIRINIELAHAELFLGDQEVKV
jgi:hypothetical protein